MYIDEEKPTQEIISINVDIINYDRALTKIIEAGKRRTPGFVCFANVHMVVEAHRDRNFARQVNSAMLVLPDGMPLVKTIKPSNGKRQERIAGMDVFQDLIRLAEREELKIFFFGTTSEILERIKIKTESDFPNIQIAGLFSPPFGRSLDDESYVDLINGSGANLVFVALGCPKQEKWMASHSAKINAILLGVGGAFPLYAGLTKRAPLWLRDLSLEWLFRLAQEPTRLLKRYFVTNTTFLYLMLRDKFNVTARKS